MTNLTIKSFANNIATISYGEEYYDKEIVVPDEYITNDMLNENEFLIYASGFAPDLKNLETDDIVDYGIPKIHLPSYITEQSIIDEINRLTSLEKIIINSVNPDYVIKLNKSLDILEHQNITSPLTDNYVYFYNRVLFLRHYKALSLSFGSEFVEPIKYLVPTSIEQIQEFIEPNKEYLVYESLYFDNAITLNSSNIVEYFSSDKIAQNIQNCNFISMRSDRQSWCIEEKHTHDYISIGYAYRFPNLRKFDHAFGVGIKFDNVVDKDKITLCRILCYTFYFYGTPFKLMYKRVGNKILVCDIDLSIDIDNPRFEQIYTSSNIPD